MKKIKLGKYQHYKGKFYEIIDIAHHSETLKEFVLYRSLYDSKEFGNNALWVRPIDLFADIVEWKGKQVPRFRFIE